MNCPSCGTPIEGVVTRGPSDHVLDPCGCRATTLTAREFADADRGRGVATDGGVSRFEDGPRECPYEEDYQHWVADGELVVHGHPVGVVCDCGDEMAFDEFYGARNETAGFACACGLDFVLAPAKCTPDHWDCFADGGRETTFLLRHSDEYHFGLERVNADDLTFRVLAPTMTDDEPEVVADGGEEMSEWVCRGCGDSFQTPGEPELPCLMCGTDDWQEVDVR